jgi:TolB-like protein
LQIVFVLLAIGFPVATAAAWRYQFGTAKQDHVAAHTDEHGSQLAIVFGVVALLVIGTVVVMRFLGYDRHGSGHETSAEYTSAQEHQPPAPAVAFAPPLHSIAVMPFVNMSGDRKDDYFSDGLTEELLNSLARINELRVAARTSSFSFKGAALDIPSIARKLNVAAVLEGSVRKSGHKVRITAQLVDAANGYELWSQTFDRELRDILALQTEIATAVMSAMKVQLLADQASKVTAGGTQHADAFDAYLRGVNLLAQRTDEASDRAAVSTLEEALRVDPQFALAHAAYAKALLIVGIDWTPDKERAQRLFTAARASAERAIELEPTLGAAYEAKALVIQGTSMDFAAVDAAISRAMELEPGSVAILTKFADAAGRAERRAEALDATARAVQLDPLSAAAWRMRGVQLYFAAQHAEAQAAFGRALELQPNNRLNKVWMARNQIVAGNVDAAIALCESEKFWAAQQCLAIAYYRDGRRADATQQLRSLQKDYGDAAAYQYAQVYAQWGERQQAIEWLYTAVRVGDAGVGDLKVDPMLDPLRSAPEFAEIVGRLQF